MPVALTAALIIGFQAAAAPAFTYPQLIATQYKSGAQLPVDSARPVPGYEFVATAKLPKGAKVLSAAKSAGGRVWVVTDRGNLRSSGDGYEPLEVGSRQLEPGQPQVTASARIVAVAADGVGQVWVATDRGLYVTDGEKWWQGIERSDGVPFEAMTCIDLAPNGDVWGGTREGAWRLRDGQFRYFWGRRWLPGNLIRAIWTDANGRAWLETDLGVALIEEKPITLAEKAVHFDQITQARHNRGGFICGIDFNTPGDPSRGYRFNVSDNDGLWTAMYVGAMALRYGATKNPEARNHARASLTALLDLERRSGIAGFPARAMATDDELAHGVNGVNLESRVHAPGVVAKAWYRSKVDPHLWCKGDTSSDELDGHYFAWYLYHDLVADDSEKKEIAAVVGRVTDHILAHDLTLVDHTGEKTRWGIWAPELINRHPFYYEQRPLNSIEILAFLKVAEHITGDARYARKFDDLIQNHHYLLNSLMMRRNSTGHWPNINHSDDELLYLVYYPLLRLEKDPSRRRILTESIARTWEEGAPGEQPIRPEHSPFYNFVYGATTGRRCDVEGATQTLEDWPWDLVDWAARGSHRTDVQILSTPGIHRHRTQLDRVLPISERSQGRWNSNPWIADGGGDGRHEHDGVAWSLGYWLGVYHGFLPAQR
jgi:hypothetical protein